MRRRTRGGIVTARRFPAGGRGRLGALMPKRRMAVRLTKSEIQLLKELTAAGQHGRIIAALASSMEVSPRVTATFVSW
jgi:hypothetical protein